jgi:type II secretory pathway component PulJ
VNAPSSNAVPRTTASRASADTVGRHFTLLEMMVALVIFTFVVTVLFTFARTVTNSWQRLQREQRRFSDLLVLDRTLDTMLSNAVPFLWRDEDNEPVPVFLGEPQRLRLAYVHATSGGESCALRFLQLEVDGEGRLVAFYSAYPFLEPEETVETAKTSVLARDVDTVEFRYADWEKVDGDSWPDALLWLEEWELEREELPLGILVTVRWTDGRVESWLRRTSASGYRERWGKWKPAEQLGETPR